MPAPIASVAERLNDILVASDRNVVTLTWKQFYELADRERLKEAFKDELSQHLREHGLLVGFGAAVVLIGKDYKFQPVTL